MYRSTTTVVHNIYRYMDTLCDHRAFMPPESCSKLVNIPLTSAPRILLRQLRPYRPRSYFVFVFQSELTPFLQWPALNIFSSTHRFQLVKTLSAYLYCSSTSNTWWWKLIPGITLCALLVCSLLMGVVLDYHYYFCHPTMCGMILNSDPS